MLLKITLKSCNLNSIRIYSTFLAYKIIKHLLSILLKWAFIEKVIAETNDFKYSDDCSSPWTKSIQLVSAEPAELVALQQYVPATSSLQSSMGKVATLFSNPIFFVLKGLPFRNLKETVQDLISGVIKLTNNSNTAILFDHLRFDIYLNLTNFSYLS